MATRKNRFATVSGILASAVVDTGTWTTAYPSGFTQASFTAGLAPSASGHYIILNGNDRYGYGTSPPGITLSFGASTITVTNETDQTLAAGTAWTLGLELYDGPARIPVTFPLPALTAITAADIITELRPGIAGYLEHAEFVTITAVSTGSKAATLNFEIGTTDVTGGTIALTSAAATPAGKTIAAAAITGANRLERESLLSLEASSVTTFSEGAGYVIAYIRPDWDDAI